MKIKIAINTRFSTYFLKFFAGDPCDFFVNSKNYIYKESIGTTCRKFCPGLCFCMFIIGQNLSQAFIVNQGFSWVFWELLPCLNWEIIDSVFLTHSIVSVANLISKNY